MSDQDFSDMTRGEYNLNPGNLRPGKKGVYPGQVGVDKDGFAVFDSYEAGRKALINQIKSYHEKGYNNPEDFIDHYSGASDPHNSQESIDNYKIHLMKQLGLKTSLDTFPDNSEERLADAITLHENNGRNRYASTTNQTNPALEGTPYDSGNGGGEIDTSGDAYSQEGTAQAATEDQNKAEESIDRKKQAFGALVGTSVGLGVASGTAGVQKGLSALGEKFGVQPDANTVLSKQGLDKYQRKMLDQRYRDKLTPAALQEATGVPVYSMSTVHKGIEALGGLPAVPETRTMSGLSGYEVTPGKPALPPVDMTQFESTPLERGMYAVGRQGPAFATGRPGPTVGNVVMGGLGSALAGWQGTGALYDMYQHGVNAENAAQGLSALGGAAQLVPNQTIQKLGMAAQLPYASMTAYDPSKPNTGRNAQAKQHQEEAILEAASGSNPLVKYLLGQVPARVADIQKYYSKPAQIGEYAGGLPPVLQEPFAGP